LDCQIEIPKTEAGGRVVLTERQKKKALFGLKDFPARDF
jgi:hypothetical protein